MENKKMLRCPICGAEVEAKSPFMGYVEAYDIWNFNHHCDPDIPDLTCSINVWGKTEEEVIERWNRRAENEE